MKSDKYVNYVKKGVRDQLYKKESEKTLTLDHLIDAMFKKCKIESSFECRICSAVVAANFKCQPKFV